MVLLLEEASGRVGLNLEGQELTRSKGVTAVGCQQIVEICCE